MIGVGIVGGGAIAKLRHVPEFRRKRESRDSCRSIWRIG